MGSYSFDVYKKMVFEKEIENLKSYDLSYDIEKSIIVDYMQDRIKEIDKEYGESPVRD